MLIVAGHFDVDPAEREEFIADRVEITRASRAEPGCITYTFERGPDRAWPRAAVRALGEQAGAGCPPRGAPIGTTGRP